MKYKAILFDVGDTLLWAYPSQKQVYSDRLKHLGFQVDEGISIRVHEAVANAANAQISKEQNGAPRMPDDDFERMLDEAALLCVADHGGVSDLVQRLRLLPLPEQRLAVIPGTAMMLQALLDKGYRLGIVSRLGCRNPCGNLR